MSEVQSFMEFVKFYQCFMQDFSHLSKPLHILTKKGESWRWTKDKQKAFEELKQLTMLAPIIVQPDHDMQFWLEMDATGYATSSILSQLCKDNKWPPIGFTSKNISSAKRNYKIHNKELLLVMQGLEEWRHMLEGIHCRDPGKP